jgi:hypothetical protein
MKRAWGRTAALIVAASVAFGTGACAVGGDDGDTPRAAATSSKAPDAKQMLLGSLAQYDKGVYAADFITVDGTGKAAIDVPKKQAYIKIISTAPDAKFTMEVLAIDPDTYMKMNLGNLSKQPGMQQLNGKTWLHINLAKLTDAASLGIGADETDMLDLKALLQSAQSVKSAGEHKYTGTLDLAKGGNSPIVDEDVVKALADKAAGVPFTATLDAEGQFTELLIDVPAAGDKKAHQAKLTVTQYGTAAVPAKPTGKAVVEASAKVYEILNG